MNAVIDVMDRSQLDSLQSKASSWTLANDSQLCTVLQDLSKYVVERAETLNSRMEKIVKNMGKLDASIDNLNSGINLQASTKFIEQKIAEESPSRPGTVVSDIKTRTMEQRQSETLSCITKAVTNGLSLIGSQFEKVSVQFPDEIASDENFKPEPQYQPKDPYASWALPIMIGSSNFYSKPYKELFDHEVEFQSSLPITSPAANKLFNDSSLLPSTSMVQDQRLIDNPGPSTSTPRSLNAPVSLSDSVLEPARTESAFPPVPDMSGFGKLLPAQDAPIPTVRVKSTSPETVNPFMPIPDVTGKSKLFDDSESGTDDDDIFAQAKRIIHKKPAVEDSLSRKSVVSEDSKKSPASMIDSGRGSPIIEKDQTPSASMNGFQPPTLSDVVAASARLKKKSFDKDTTKTADGAIFSSKEVKPNQSVGANSSSMSSMVNNNFDDENIFKIAAVNDKGANKKTSIGASNEANSKMDSDFASKEEPLPAAMRSSNIPESVNGVHTDGSVPATSEKFDQKCGRPSKISQLMNGSDVAVDESNSGLTKKLMFDKDLDKEEKKENSILKKKPLSFAPKHKSLFDSDSDTDDLFTLIKKPSSENSVPVVKSAPLPAKAIEKKSGAPKQITKLPVKKDLFSDQSDDDSLFLAKPAAQKSAPEKIDHKEQLVGPAVQSSSQSKVPLDPGAENSIPSADQTVFGEKELNVEPRPSAVPKKVLIDTESEIENSVSKVGSEDSTTFPDPFNISPQLAEEASTRTPSLEVQENGAKSPLDHKNFSFESIWDKPPELPQQFSGKSIPDTSDWSHESEDSDSDMSVRGKLATSAFANKLNATLTRPPPPGGVRLFPTTPKSSEEQVISTSREQCTTKVTQKPLQSKKIAPESTTKLFDDHPQLLTSTLKGRAKGPIRRLPKKIAKAADVEEVKHDVAPPPSSTTADSVVCQTSVTKSACQKTENERMSSVANVTPSPSIGHKESTGSIRRKISITSTSVKDATAKSTLSTSITSKKSIFDSESSDDDLFKKKSTIVIKKSASTEAKSKQPYKPPPTTTSVKESNSTGTKASCATIPAKKSLFDDSDDDLDLFQKK